MLNTRPMEDPLLPKNRRNAGALLASQTQNKPFAQLIFRIVEITVPSIKKSVPVRLCSFCAIQFSVLAGPPLSGLTCPCPLLA